MAEISWLNDASGDFDTASGWSSDTVPGASDDAILDASGSNAYTVTASTNETVLGVQTGSNATLVVNGGTFTVGDGTDGGVNAGTISVSNGATLSLSGTVDNAGSIAFTPAIRLTFSSAPAPGEAALLRAVEPLRSCPTTGMLTPL